jgi:hypothetical protein
VVGRFVRVATQSCFAIGPATTSCDGVCRHAAHPVLIATFLWQTGIAVLRIVHNRILSAQTITTGFRVSYRLPANEL